MHKIYSFFSTRLTHPPDETFSAYHMYQPRQKPRILVHLILFMLTLSTTLYAGARMAGVNPVEDMRLLIAGIPFSFSLLFILGVHEFAHYAFARKWGVEVSLPYFIPAPTAIGTMGALIRMRGVIPSRRALFEIGASGPLAGFFAAIGVIIVGLHRSSIQLQNSDVGGWILGDSLLFKGLGWLVWGTPVAGYDIYLSPMAFAGWIGLLVTMLNLLPIGQLDGGHITYALWGRKFRYIIWFFIVCMVGMGFLWPGWWAWIVITFLIGHRHPPPLDTVTPLSRGHRIAAWTIFFVFIVAFMPVPIQL